MRVALFGSPAFAIPTLEALDRHHRVALVVSQPDKPAGRGLSLRRPATARRAEELGLRVAQPARLRDPEFYALLTGLDLDVAVTAAYGKLLPASLLELPRYGFLNVHASLLPRYRGAAPIQWALINGDQETGVTVMQTEAGLDTGPIRLQMPYKIAADASAADLFGELAELGAQAMREALAQLAAGTLPCRPQNDDEATVAPLLTREDGRIHWRDSAKAVYNRFRGVQLWPGSWTGYGGKTLKVTALRPSEETGPAGQVLKLDADGVLVGAGAGSVRLEKVKPQGKGEMSARAWANGYGVRRGDSLG